MLDILTSDKKKIKILEVLFDGKVHTFYHLSKVVKTNFETVKKNCRFFELLNLVEINRISKNDSASGVASYRVRITDNGLKIIKDIPKKMSSL